MLLFFIFSLLSLAYIIYVYLLYFAREDKFYEKYDKPFSVIIPCYNEGYKELKECVNSILIARGDKQIILVNNNSNKEETIRAIKEFSNNPKILLLKEKRQGKRFAHSKGLKYAKHDLIVFVDSDTIVDKNAFLELIKPFQDEKIGGVCGNIKIKNRNDNFLTKCLDSMYWNSFEFHRQAVSSLSYLYVCSGALASYRKELLLRLEKEYLNQKFLGSKCSISDDTFMTIRIQSKLGYKIAYQNDSIAYTYSPNKIKGFWKQLVRWRQGFLRESILMWNGPKKNIIPLFLDVQTNLILQSSVSIMRIYFFFWLIFGFSLYNLIGYLIVFLVSSILLSSAQIVIRPKKIFYILGYSFIYDFFFVFTFIHASINIKNQGTWGTR
jgi:hyaluronan synthase